MKMKNLFVGLLLALGLVIGPVVADDDSIRDVDDNAATFSGSWGTSTQLLLYYGDDYQYAWGSGSATPTAEATWTTKESNDVTGEYQIFVRWSVQENREESAYYRVYDGVADASPNCGCYKNQTIDGGAWQFCCATQLTAGQKGVVKLGNENTSTNEVVIADGVRFVRASVDSGDIVNGSIHDYDIADEAGVEWANWGARTLGSIAQCTDTNWTNVASFNMTVPTSGYVILGTSGYHNPDYALHHARVCISTDTLGKACNTHSYIMERETSANYSGEMRWALNDVAAVSAGSRSFYLKACKEFASTQGQLGWNDFYGIFVPTRY